MKKQNIRPTYRDTVLAVFTETGALTHLPQTKEFMSDLSCGLYIRWLKERRTDETRSFVQTCYDVADYVCEQNKIKTMMYYRPAAAHALKRA